LIASAVLLIAQAPAFGQETPPAPLKVLFVGNSYTSVNDLPSMAAGLAEAAGGRKIDVDRHLVGGCTLEKHVKDQKAIDKIRAEKWDVVVLQEQSLRPVIDRQSMHEYARLGDFEGSDVFLNDYVLIEELRKWKGSLYLDKPALREALNVLGDEAARHFEVVLQQAVAQYPSVIAVIHVPPFKEAAWYNGRHSDDNYLPHFACKAVGDVMRKIMEANPKSRLLVLCGHTHGSGEVQILENLQVLTGGAEYRNPVIQRIFDIG
jgi:hypothetical protein